ncbi:fumarylacetoacetate hydrolase family protein [Halomontanus rarus]
MSQLVFDVRYLIASITADMTLEPGNIVLAGSP